MKTLFQTCLFCASVMIAGADGPYTPFPNILGVIALAFLAYWLVKDKVSNKYLKQGLTRLTGAERILVKAVVSENAVNNYF